MSGHSKWHNIQARKGKQDSIRSNQFTKIAKMITVAAQKGGDPAMNFSLRIAVEKAKEVGMPKDNIERAIKRGTGELEGARMEELLYEAFGPGGAAILIKVTTDNKNRTISEIKHILSTNGGSLGGAGSVQWMFGQWGVILADSSQFLSNRDVNEMALIEAGAEDISEEDGEIEIRTKIENLQKTQNKLRELGMGTKEASIRWVAKDKLRVDEKARGQLEALFAGLEANDDVEDYYTNAI